MSINSLQSEQLCQQGREQSGRLWGEARSWLRIAASSGVTFPDLTPSCCFWTPCKTSLSSMTSICHKQFFLSHLLTPGISHISSVRNTEAALGTISLKCWYLVSLCRVTVITSERFHPKFPRQAINVPYIGINPLQSVLCPWQRRKAAARMPSLIKERKKWMLQPSENMGRF